MGLSNIALQVEIFNATMRLVSDQLGGLPPAVAAIAVQIIRTNIRAGQTDPIAIAAATIAELRSRAGMA
jgi:hypothetical protein